MVRDFEEYQSPILVTGCARSGTSMTAGILNHSGAFGGKMSGPNKHNKRGMFENTEIRQNICKPFLRSIGADPMGQYPLPDLKKVWAQASHSGLVRSFRNQIMEIMVEQGLSPEKKWFYKGAKICLFWPLWRMAFPEASWVIVRRNREDIISSCMKTSFMRAYSDRIGWGSWVDFHETRFEEMKENIPDWVEYWPEQAIGGDLNPTWDLLQRLGLTANPKLVSDFIDPVLWRNRDGESKRNRS